MHQSYKEKTVQRAENQLLQNEAGESLAMDAMARDTEWGAEPMTATEQIRRAPKAPGR
jgi:hypothetical protein